MDWFKLIFRTTQLTNPRRFAMVEQKQRVKEMYSKNAEPLTEALFAI